MASYQNMASYCQMGASQTAKGETGTMKSDNATGYTTATERLAKTAEMRPTAFGMTHQDSMFANSFQSKPYFVVHPEWNSEGVANIGPHPLDRPPWPWEQPRYRVNMQIPITYRAKIQDAAEGGTLMPVEQPDWDYSQEVPPLSYHLSQAYRSSLPQYVVRY